MGTLNEDLTGIKAVEDKLTANKVANFAYTDHAYNNPLTEADGVTVYDVNHEQNIPVADPTVLNVNETVLSKGWRSQASAITRMLMNHFLGRVSYNLNKLNDNFSATLATIMSHLGQPNGIATLDANGRIPYAQLPESAIEYEGNWNASTNTPTLVNGTGTKGDFYICNVAGTVDFGDGAISFLVNDRVIYDGAVWSKLSAGDVRTVNGITPDSATGNVQLAKGDIGLGSVVNTRDSANAFSEGTAKFTTGGAYNLLISLASLFNTSTAYAVGDIITYQNRLYECTTAHSAGAWKASHFTARSVEYLLRTYILPSLAPVFSASTAYTVGQFVIYQNKLYRCTTAHSAGAWNSSHFTLANLNDVVNAGNATGTLPITHGGTGKTTASDALNAFINALSTGDSNPQDADYFISQHSGGGTTTTSYHRRPVSTIWEYIKSKITGAISGVLTSNLTASRMVVTDADGKLTVASRIGVTGVKGDSETGYRTGDVNITKANVGLSSVANTGDSETPASGGTTKFTTGGAFNFFDTENCLYWLARVFGKSYGETWRRVGTSFTFDTTISCVAQVPTSDTESTCYMGMRYGASAGLIEFNVTKTSNSATPTTSKIGSDGNVIYDLHYVKELNILYASVGSKTSPLATEQPRGLWRINRNSSSAWARVSNGSTYKYLTITHSDVGTIAGSDGHGIWYSANGATFNQASPSTIQTSTCNSIAWGRGAGHTVASINGKGLWYCTTPNTWTQSPTTAVQSLTFNFVKWVGNYFIAGYNGGAYYSKDGIVWTQCMSLGSNYNYTDVTFFNGLYMLASSSSNYPVYFTDDVTYIWRNIYADTASYAYGGIEKFCKLNDSLLALSKSGKVLKLRPLFDGISFTGKSIGAQLVLESSSLFCGATNFFSAVNIGGVSYTIYTSGYREYMLGQSV